MTPALQEFVSAATAERLIAAADAGIADLVAEVRRTEAAAEALEAAVGTGFDPGALEFVIVRFDRFVQGLLAESAAEVDALVAAVQRRRAPVALSWGHLFEEADPPEPVVVVAPVPAPVSEPIAVSVPETVPAASPAPVPLPDAAAPDGAGASAATATAPRDDAEVIDALEAEFWADDEPAARWPQIRRMLRTVGLQAAAVLLVLVAVLIRIG